MKTSALGKLLARTVRSRINFDAEIEQLQPTAMALELGMPHFVVFDADGNTQRPEHRTRHERDNRAIISLLGVQEAAFPDHVAFERNCAIWPENMGATGSRPKEETP